MLLCRILRDTHKFPKQSRVERKERERNYIFQKPPGFDVSPYVDAQEVCLAFVAIACFGAIGRGWGELDVNESPCPGLSKQTRSL